MVPRVGFEPTTYRLRSGCSTAELPGQRPVGDHGAYRDELLASNPSVAKPIRDRISRRRVPGWQFPSFGTRRLCHNRESGAGGGPGRRPPRQSIKTAAMRTEGSPFEAFSATSGADIARVGHRGNGSVEPFARPRADTVFRLLKPR